MLWIFRFIKGYLTVVITGDCTELLLNSAARNGITFWDLRCLRCGIEGKIGINDFKRLRKYRKIGLVKIKIKRRHGMPFYLVRCRKKAGFLAGTVIFFAILYFLSGFVWVIRSEGNVSVGETEILGGCKRLGVYEGIPKSKIKNKILAQKLLMSDERLAWCSFNLEGCVLTVDITESKKKQEKENPPSNLKASGAGVIKKIDVTSGNVMCKAGDFVETGTLLVSGISEDMNSTVFSRSSGVITAETTREFTFSGNFDELITVTEDKARKHSVLEFFGLKIPLYLGKVGGNNKENVTVHQMSLFGQRLPVRLTVKSFYRQQKKKADYTAEELEKKLQDRVDCALAEVSPQESEQIERTVTEIPNGLTLTAKFKCTENIAVEEKIIMDTKN